MLVLLVVWMVAADRWTDKDCGLGQSYGLVLTHGAPERYEGCHRTSLVDRSTRPIAWAQTWGPAAPGGRRWGATPAHARDDRPIDLGMKAWGGASPASAGEAPPASPRVQRLRTMPSAAVCGGDYLDDVLAGTVYGGPEPLSQKAP
ncbi:hypothetical protein ACH49_18265 [Streptomyces leeuwenhoekii]|uniref:Secreted Protein n=1 Tax=Streptomyces leeuwenhoekii TaxID=1437453 RepID=A0ABR5HWP4_STRLW|nr:hypothetical protein ACH49_18265 [Streptomyces leeuwenhoekii]